MIPSLLWTLETASSIVSTSPFISNVNVVNIQKWICGCFTHCTFFTYEQSVHVVNYGVIPSLLKVLELHVNMLKEKGRKMDKLVVCNASITLSNISNKGLNKSSEREKNKFRSSFDSVDGVRRLCEMFNYLNTQQKHSPLEKKAVDDISLCVCRLLKSDTPPEWCVSLLFYVKEMKSSPTPPSGYEFPSAARNAWDRMVGADECVEKFKEKKNICL
jgi:hypothetical protein